ncbi:MAG: MBL fold metallo-hydrolase [Finegoldia sp.]|nr:MBL fold metallo-hydrolase [Finegoldia sp.]
MSFKFCSLASGSSGNSEYIETDHAKILIDAGLTGKKIEGLLKSISVDPYDLDAILITHEHADHIKGAGVLSRRYNIPIIANIDTWYAMDEKIGKVADNNIYVFKNNEYFNFKDLDILPIATSHDSASSCGYIINKDNKKISIVTDIGVTDDFLMENILDSKLYFIEANHDIDMLRYGKYPMRLKQRIASNRGHLSNDACADILADSLRGNHEFVKLAHLSRENNTEKIAYDTVNNYLTSLGLDTKRDISLGVAKRSEVSDVIDLEKMEEYGKNFTRN